MPDAVADTGWDDYWGGTREAAPHRLGRHLEEELEGFWAKIFDGALQGSKAQRLLDAGCGNGAVTRFALAAAGRAGRPAPLVHGVDRSLAALKDLLHHFPSVSPVAADSARIPFPDGCFDIVTSQFGLEYGGGEAFSEASRLVAPGGTLAAAIHLKGGGLYRECAVNLQAVTVVTEGGLLPAARDVFRESHGLARGKGSKGAFRRANEALAAAVRRVDEVLLNWGEGVAGGAVHRVYADIAHMYGRRGAYDPEEVSRWAEASERELTAYASRMSAMVEAAIDPAGMDAIVERVSSCGLSVRIREELRGGAAMQEPVAWILVCERVPAR